MKRFQRIVSEKTIETYQELNGSLGSAQSLDYQSITGGQASQFGNCMADFIEIDFMADVLKAAKDTLDGDELSWYLRLLNKDSSDFTRQTEAQMKAHEKVGRTILGRGLFTYTRYVNTLCDN